MIALAGKKRFVPSRIAFIPYNNLNSIRYTIHCQLQISSACGKESPNQPISQSPIDNSYLYHMSPRSSSFYNGAAIICGIWFILTSSLWVYFANLVISFPIGLLGMYLWNRGRILNKENIWNKIALGLLVIGFVLAFVVLGILMYKN